jgi:RimJ/RimL family protein N-acetyltransferase
MARSPVSLDELDTATHAALPARLILQQWRRLPPVLRAGGVTLREPRIADAPALLAALSPDDLTRIAGPSGVTFDGVADFIDRAREERALGQSLSLAVIPDHYTAPVGLFRVVQTAPDFGCAEWAFALGSAFWGGGLFFLAAPVVADFVFDVLGAHRLEARVSVRNGRGTGALRKLGAVQEALMRDALLYRGEAIDLVLWTIVADEWRERRPSGVYIH